MTDAHIEAVWSARAPAVWPSLPEYLTYSTLLEVEACPRRWGLASAAYPEVWTGRGYPPRLSIPRIAGSIVHDVIDKVTGALVKRQCPSIRAPEAVQIMRESGGFTRLLEDSTARALSPYASNPRAHGQLDAVRRTLQARFPDLRRRAQSLLMTVSTPPLGPSLAAVDARVPTGVRSRAPLRTGTHSEVDVLAPAIGWRGTIDLLTVAPSDCAITDFKTGERKTDHALQVRIYALLWSMDGELNPTRAPATSLMLAYPGGLTNVPAPDSDELDALRAELVARTDAARAYDAVRPPAKPSAVNCLHCDVRHVCDDYWTRDVQMSIRAAAQDSDICDGEFVLSTGLGASNWEITPRSAPTPWNTPRSVLRCSDSKVELRSGHVVRVLDGNIWRAADEPSVTTLNVGPSSEIYIVPKPKGSV